MRPPTMHLLDLHYCESIGGVIPRTSPAARGFGSFLLLSSAIQQAPYVRRRYLSNLHACVWLSLAGTMQTKTDLATHTTLYYLHK